MKTRLLSVNTQVVLACFLLFLLLLYSARLFVVWSHQVRHNQEGTHLHALTLAVTQYAEENGGCLPPMRPLSAFQAAVLPYTHNPAVFHQHGNPAVLFLPNPNLSGRSLFSLRRPTVLLYEAAPSSADGSRWAAFRPVPPGPPPFGDPDFAGLRLVPEREWRHLQAADNLT